MKFATQQPAVVSINSNIHPFCDSINSNKTVKKNSFAENKFFFKRRSGFLPINFYDVRYFLERVNCKYIGVSVFMVHKHTIITVIFFIIISIACYRNVFIHKF